MLERQLELEGGLTVCRLGALRPEGGQALECVLRLEGVQPGRRVALWVEALTYTAAASTTSRNRWAAE